ncbi:DUF3368 domain-containing protein [Pedobacter sp. SD-b]|uniref:DUF3368 domain-containing protein n=1 Tax=Pedobacter segetis TaxID=2793069 RepID=A0ABS1BHF2_9SPHI|nr:DUF3368 domain-containing protein [Pedobacter segetis]MBK0382275.1 DUF3368 domain-containing protein [Pedobacter segetis]
MENDKIVIIDARCFIVLEKIGALPLLNKLYLQVVTTTEIAAEYKEDLPTWITIQNVINRDLIKTFQNIVDLGESSAIALANEINHSFIVIDDLQARKFASSLGLNVKGTIGVLLEAKQNEVIQTIKPYLDKIQKTNFRISDYLIVKILESAGEI